MALAKFGLACDNLLSADVVTADGPLVTASGRENDDLFWGLTWGEQQLRGGDVLRVPAAPAR